MSLFDIRHPCYVSLLCISIAILSAPEDKIRIPARSCNILFLRLFFRLSLKIKKNKDCVLHCRKLWAVIGGFRSIFGFYGFSLVSEGIMIDGSVNASFVE